MSYNEFESRTFNSIMLFSNEVFNILANKLYDCWPVTFSYRDLGKNLSALVKLF